MKERTKRLKKFVRDLYEALSSVSTESGDLYVLDAAARKNGYTWYPGDSDGDMIWRVWGLDVSDLLVTDLSDGYYDRYLHPKYRTSWYRLGRRLRKEVRK